MYATEWGIFCTYWYFWTFKTLWNVALIIKKLQNNEIVFSNIKMNKNLLPYPDNFYYFDDIKCLKDILAFSWLFALEVSKFNDKAFKNLTSRFSRNYRPKISIIFDEMGIFANSSEYKKFHQEVWEDLTQYLLQIRKLFVDLYFIIQKPWKLVKELRDYVQYWIRPYPTFSSPFWILDKKCITYYFEVLNDDTFKIETEKDFKYDFLTNSLNSYEKPLRFEYFSIWWVPYYFDFYDDLFLNLPKKPIFESTFLKDIWFIDNLYLWRIKNPALIDNLSIYEKDFNGVIISDKNLTTYKKPNYSDYFLYCLVRDYKQFSFKKWFFWLFKRFQWFKK